MKKILKLVIGGIAGFILFLYLTMPLVKVEGENLSFIGYLTQIFDNMGEVLADNTLSQMDMLYGLIAWLFILVALCAPIGCLITIGIKAILSGVFTKRNLKMLTLELVSFVASGFLILFFYYLVHYYTLPSDANGLQIIFVKIACSHIWQPLLYISAFGTLFLLGLNIYVNSMKKNKKEEE